jgi:hypothetical protein
VRAGDTVRAGETPLAEFAPSDASAARAAAEEAVPC